MGLDLKTTWRTMAPERKRRAVVAASIIGVIVLGIGGYYARSKPLPKRAAAEKPVSLIQTSGTLEKSLYQQSQKELQKRDQQMEELRAELARMATEKGQEKEATQQPASLPRQSPPSSLSAAPLIPHGVGDPNRGQQPLSYPPPPLPPAVGEAGKVPPPREVVTVGEIGVATAPAGRSIASEDKKKAEGQTIYLPPSFMAATLLSGLDAPTSEAGQGSPVPALLRIQDLAVLPNSVKADLKGCFVIAEGLGNLADERAHMRLVSLSCLTREGQAVIDQPIKGFLVDQDGKIGLKGRVVSRMGAAIARSMVAGVFGGMGDYITAQNTIVSTSALGTTQSINPNDALKYGLGAGLSSAFKDTQKFYLDLAKQALPVIEIGATKQVTLVIEKGVTLELRDPSKEK